MNLLSDARAFHQNRGLFGGVGQAGQFDGERCLLGQSDQQFAVLHIGRRAPEAEDEKPYVARGKHQRIDHDADIALAPMKREHPGPNLPIILLDIDVQRLELPPEHFSERRTGERHAGSERRLFKLVVTNVSENPPFLHGMFGHDHST